MDKDKGTSRFCLILCNHWSYIGIGWQLGLESCAQSITDSLDLADRNPGVKVCINLDALAYVHIAQQYPEIAHRLRQYLQAGKTEIIGGSYAQPMGSMISGESNVRQLVMGVQTIENALGFRVTSFLEEEEFTHPQLPQLLRGAGYACASMAQCDTWGNAGNPVLDKNSIYWVGKDGTEIPCAPRTALYFHPPVVTSDVDYLLSEEAKEKIERLSDDGVPLVTVWTEFGWEEQGSFKINKFDFNNYINLQQRYPDAAFVTLGEYMAQYANPDAPRVQLTAADYKKLLPWGIGGDQLRVFGRRAESKLLMGEKWSLIASLLGGDAELQALEQACGDLLVSQSHDVSLCEYSVWGGGVIPPHGIEMNTHNMTWGAIGFMYLDRADAAARTVLSASVAHIAAQTDRQSAGAIRAITVFNPSLWARTDRVITEKLHLPDNTAADLEIRDAHGAVVACQLDSVGRNEDGGIRYARLSFTATDIPAFGYSSYFIHPSATQPESTTKKPLAQETADRYVLENDYITVAVCRATGQIKSLVQKSCGREFVGSEDGLLAFAGEACTEHLKMHRMPDASADFTTAGLEAKVTLLSAGPVEAVVKVQYELPGVTVCMLLTLAEAAPALDVELRMAIHIPPKGAEGNINGWQLPVAFSDGYWLKITPAFKVQQMRQDYPFALEQSSEKATGLSFVDLVGADSGLLVNHSGTQYFLQDGDSVKNLVVREWDSHFLGRAGWPRYTVHNYRFTPYTEPMTASALFRLSEAFDQKPVCAVSEPQAGQLPLTSSFIRIDNADVLVSSLRAVDGGWELRAYEVEGRDVRSKISCGFEISSAAETTLSGEALKPISVEGNEFTISLAPYEVKTIAVK